jgi:hypothetical protein
VLLCAIHQHVGGSGREVELCSLPDLGAVVANLCATRIDFGRARVGLKEDLRDQAKCMIQQLRETIHVRLGLQLSKVSALPLL